MRHLRKTKKFHRNQEERVKLFRDLSSALIKSEQIVTFTARAKWFRSKFERLITLCKRAGDDSQLAFRRLRPDLSEEDARKMVFEIAPRYKNRAGGYTAIYKLQAEFSDLDKSVVVLVKDDTDSTKAETKEEVVVDKVEPEITEVKEVKKAKSVKTTAKKTTDKEEKPKAKKTVAKSDKKTEDK